VLPELNFPQYEFRFRKNAKGENEIFDRVRKKFVSLSPEEWVRQHVVEYLVKQKNFPASLLSVEKQLMLNGTAKRADVLAYSTQLRPILIVECKAPEVKLDVHTLSQVLRYNLVYNAPYLFITNGIDHFFFFRDTVNPGWCQSETFPVYGELLK
jgi:type I site-specific restriction endonuclease